MRIVGRRGVVAILGASAFAIAGGALLVGENPRYEADKATPIGRAALAALEAARDRTLQELAGEAAVAAAIPQIGAALHNKVDVFTIEDLFQSERWWVPYRARGVSLVGPAGPIVTQNMPAPGPGGGDLRLRARAAGKQGSAAGVALLGDRPFLEAASVIDVAEPLNPAGGTPWTLILGRPLDDNLLKEWATAAQAALLVSDGRRALLSGGGDGASARAQDLVGHEAGARVVDASGGWVATTLALAPGLWLWTVRPLPLDGSPARSRQLWAVAALLGSAALGLEVARRRRKNGADSAAVGPGANARTLSDPPPPAAPGVAVSAPMPLPPSGSTLATMIASGDSQSFGRYTVVQRLGEGGMCELFIAGLAGPEGFQRTLVLKRLKPAIARDRAAVDQFIDEAKLGSTLVHSNIVPVFDFGRVGDGYFIAQEYVVGRNVGELVERQLQRLREPLDAATIFYVAYEALQALAYAHEKTNDDGEPLHLVHRDVSPGNILVGARGEVKLIDFGIAKAEGRVSHTDLGNVKGNAAFMAPEQARGQPIDGRADLFSLGLVIFYALTGQPLYRGGTLAEVFYAAASGPTAEQLAGLSRLPPVAAKVLTRALALDPAARYPNADEFAADLVDHITPGSRTSVATLLHALFGPELRPLSGASPGTGPGTSGLRRKTG